MVVVIKLALSLVVAFTYFDLLRCARLVFLLETVQLEKFSHFQVGASGVEVFRNFSLS
jgi:hypothetical protein